MRKICVAILVLLVSLPCFAAKEPSVQTLTWPASGAPMVRLTFTKFKQLVGGFGKEHTYVTDSTAENLSDTVLGTINLSLYVFDKTHVRVGDSNIYLTNVKPHETVRFQVTLNASGVPTSVAVAATPPQTISITINSVPQGAIASLDGKEIGTTPKIAEVAPGKHMLVFSKNGYSTGQFPLEIGTHDANGGSVSYELGTSSHDTIELRDGSVLSGDLLSIDGKQVQIRIGGAVQTYDRNQIKRVLLTQRGPATD